MRIPTAPDGSRGCSALARCAGEPLAGSAGQSTGWLLIEHPGPWRHPALSSPGLEEAATRISERLSAHDVRCQLIKRPGSRSPRAGGRAPGARSAYFVHSGRGRPWARRVEFGALEELLEADLAAPGRPDPPDWGIRVERPVYLVCTHAKKDPCCAVSGRPVAAALGASGADVWETTHVGGDRFAANLVALPHGVYFGRLTPESAHRTVAAFERGDIDPRNFRGRCTDPPAAQAAEAALRSRLGVLGVDAVAHLDQAPTERGHRVVLHAQGRVHTVDVSAAEGPARPATCSADSPSRPLHHSAVRISSQAGDAPSPAL